MTIPIPSDGACTAVHTVSAFLSMRDLVISRITQEGPVSFRDFMDMALYHPDAGYYTSAQNKLGKEGDYYTSATLTCIYGQMIARQLEEMWLLMGKNPFTIVEIGAGTGRLCFDILNHLKHNTDMYDKLRYCIIEKSSVMRAKERELLDEKVTWHDCLADIGDITGCILSNELIDNLPVHRVVMKNDLMELFIDYNDGFTEVLRPAAPVLTSYLDKLNIILPEDHYTEINLDATAWITEVSRYLKSGYVLTVDYGYTADELCNAKWREGSVACYSRHTVNYNPYNEVGLQDITAHVNFSALQQWGADHGLICCGYTSQSSFLHALGIAGHLREMELQGLFDHLNIKEKLFLVNTLLMDMGEKFKVLIQRKNCPDTCLSGLLLSKPGDLKAC